MSANPRDLLTPPQQPVNDMAQSCQVAAVETKFHLLLFTDTASAVLQLQRHVPALVETTTAHNVMQ